ncbi:MAG: alpha/beta fold hydrolase [Promethearchaeota archaeon]
MKRLRGLGKRDKKLDLDLYKVKVPIPGFPGMNLSVIDIFPENAPKTIMFVHGFAGCAETWEYQINAFTDYHIIIPDLRGHGQSDAPDSDYTMEELVDDLYTITQTLDFPEKFVLVGHSFGGSICVEFATKYPELLEKLVLLSTAGEYPLSRPARAANKIPAFLMRRVWKYRPKWNAEVHVLKRMSSNNMSIWKGWEMLENIKTTSLIITGAEDRYFPRWVFVDVCNKVPGAEIIDMGASKHKVQLERHTAVNRAIKRFIHKDEGKEQSSWRGQENGTGSVPFRPWFNSYGKHTPQNIPIPRKPLFFYLDKAANWIPNKVATIFYGSEIPYGELNKQVNQFANMLLKLGVKFGDRVMVILPNMPQMIIAYYGTLKIGAVVVLPNPDAGGKTIITQIKQTKAKALVTLKAFSGLAKTILSIDVSPLKIILTDIKNFVSKEIYKQLIVRWQSAGLSQLSDKDAKEIGYDLEALMAKSSTEPPNIEVKHTDLAAILFTSGTTDEPKGVCLTHYNLVANVFQNRHWLPKLNWGRETFLSVIPLTHSFGMTIAMNVPIAIGATMILLSVFEQKQVLEHIKKYKPTLFPGVPSIYMVINSIPGVRSYGLSSLKACICGAAPLPVEVQEAFEKLTHGRLIEGYGLTEASPVTHINPYKGIGKVGTIGVPISNTDAKIIDLMTGEDVPSNQIGELLVKGPQVMQGYWDPEKESNFDTSSITDGWLHTGDVAVQDNDGYFKIISRKRDTIMAGEFSVFPRDIEEVLYENSNVMEVAVVGIEMGADKQKIKAFVVPRPGVTLTKEELLDLCRRRLDEYAVPWEIEFREELPKSFVGKVLRRMLTD